ncbi:MAG: zinc-binding alcohol dehydrogenase family protein [Chloroflexi bacterium]|nr:MAG: zinc-binding alcohol dehydrogenase family protein [Chloroflexota bacterium]
MLAHRLYAPKKAEEEPLVFEEVPVPHPGPGEILIRVKACGVCHTDLHTIEGEIHPPKLPIIPGHQVVGKVEAAGEGVTRFRGGERVGIPWLYESCGRCEFCWRGEENLCVQPKFTGFHVNGGFAELMLASASFALPLPDAFEAIKAAPLLCAGIIGYRSLKKGDIQPKEHVGLVGFGASAHLAIQIAKYWDCKVSVFTRSEEHRRHARELGADWTGTAEDEPEQPLDRAIIFAPSGTLVPEILKKLRPGGTLAINAIYMSDIPAFPYVFIYGERTLRSVANATYRDGEEFLKLAEEIPVRTDVTTYPFADANKSLIDLKHSRINGEAVLVMK